MSGKDKDRYRNQMISFRISSREREELEARIRASGLLRSNFIIRSCLTSKVVVVGKKEQVIKIVDELKIMDRHMQDIMKQIQDEELSITSKGLADMEEEYIAMLKAIIWILDGAKYLWQ